MPINPDAVGSTSDPHEASWKSKDCLLYALGVGAGVADPTGFELEFTTENTSEVEQKVLPTFPVVVGGLGGGAFGKVGSFNPAMLVHGEQSVTLHGPLPVEGTISAVSTITGIYDKGSGAVIASESVATDTSTGKPLWTTTMSAFIRGEGGFGGDRGPSGRIEFPDRAPDHSVTYQTRPDQALLYRLSGDRNPLHSDPKFAAIGGFDKPILHGLCTFGFTGRALLHTLCGSDPSRFLSVAARFSKPVMPGDALTVSMWVQGDGQALFQTSTDAGVVIDGGQLTYQA
ncbi:MAG TPA: MaoC/PaaZ C-terminal domain-containing protein [Acidimicrobiales bacterium]|jgi:acyl dehydratase|nr:MaoC/PaaZ C-terminal domain-containing protein [Acidimicrobiales bacterium]